MKKEWSIEWTHEWLHSSSSQEERRECNGSQWFILSSWLPLYIFISLSYFWDCCCSDSCLSSLLDTSLNSLLIPPPTSSSSSCLSLWFVIPFFVVVEKKRGKVTKRDVISCQKSTLSVITFYPSSSSHSSNYFALFLPRILSRQVSPGCSLLWLFISLRVSFKSQEKEKHREKLLSLRTKFNEVDHKERLRGRASNSCRGDKK